MFGERRLSKREMDPVGKYGVHRFLEDNGHQLRKELKQESKAFMVSSRFYPWDHSRISAMGQHRPFTL